MRTTLVQTQNLVGRHQTGVSKTLNYITELNFLNTPEHVFVCLIFPDC